MYWDYVLLNAYYAGNAIAFLIRDIFWLRIVIVIAGFCMIARGILLNNVVIIGWISIFTLINIYQIISLIRAKQDVKLVSKLQKIYDKTFSDMTKREFVKFWNLGYDKFYNKGEIILQDGDKMERLYLIISGKVIIKKNENSVTRLDCDKFIGEMSFLSENPVSADVLTENNVELRTWNRNILNHLNKNQHQLYNKFHLILSKDLIKKLKNYL